MLRDAVARGTELGKKVESILAAGELVSDDIVLSLIRERIAGEAGPAGREGGWILDGFPRTVVQAEGLETMLTEAGQSIDAVVVLDVERDGLIGRLLDRARADDTPETVANRLDVYKQQTIPILDFFDGKLPILLVDGNGSIDEVTETIERVLQ
jgi:adenylate kinase